MNWPNSIPYFTEDDVHNLVDGEYTIREKSQIKRSSMGWMKHLFLDLTKFGPLDFQLLDEAEAVFRKIAGIPRQESIEEWNDQQTRQKIADVLNKTMKELGYK